MTSLGALGLAMRDRREDVGIFDEREGRRAGRAFLDLLLARLRRRASRRRRRRRSRHRPAAPPRRPPACRARFSTCTTLTPADREAFTGPRDQRDVGARLGRGARDGVALLAGRAVGDVAHRIDRLVRRPRGDQHALAGERPAAVLAEQLRSRRRQSRSAPPCGRRRPRRAPPSRRRSGRRRQCRRRAVAQDCAASPDAAHMCGFIAGAISTGLSVASSTVEARSSASPFAILAIRSAVAGATTTRSVSRASRIWPTSNSRLASNRSVKARLARERAGRQRRDEFLRRLGHHDAHRGAALLQAPDQVERLVGGDAAADDEQDALAGSRPDDQLRSGVRRRLRNSIG